MQNNTGEFDNKRVIEQLSFFSEEQWQRWITGLLNNALQPPVIYFPQAEDINILLAIYNAFARSEATFLKAIQAYLNSIAKLLATIPAYEVNAEKIFTLIYFIHETQPLYISKQIENIIKEERLAKLYFKEVDLHLFLIKAYTQIEPSSKNLMSYLNYKLNEKEVDPYLYYVYLIYHFKVEEYELTLEKTWQILLKRGLNYDGCKELVFALREFLIKQKSVDEIYEWFRRIHFYAREEDNFENTYNTFIYPFHHYCNKNKIIDLLPGLVNSETLRKFDDLLDSEFTRIPPSTINALDELTLEQYQEEENNSPTERSLFDRLLQNIVQTDKAS